MVMALLRISVPWHAVMLLSDADARPEIKV
jgi:hypothetical protein